MPKDQESTDPETPIVSYLPISEKTGGNFGDLRPCSRATPVKGYNDWLTLPDCPSFDICPSCFDNTVAPTAYRHFFIPSAVRPSESEVICDFGGSSWYRLAWQLTQKRKLENLDLFRCFEDITPVTLPCLREYRSNAPWFSIIDPDTAFPISGFNVCQNCVVCIAALLPALKDVFVSIERSDTQVCNLRSDSKRFSHYFNALEKAAGGAVDKVLDIREFGRVARKWALLPECQRSIELHLRSWYVINQIPEFTVCLDCFNEVVLPGLEKRKAIPLMFDIVLLPKASCQLYSPRMRDLFMRAVETNDLNFLARGAKTRKSKQSVYRAELGLLDRESPDSEARITELRAEWMRWDQGIGPPPNPGTDIGNEPPSLDHGDESVDKGENQQGLKTKEEWERLRRIELDRGESSNMMEQATPTTSGQSVEKSTTALDQIDHDRQQAVDTTSSERSPSSSKKTRPKISDEMVFDSNYVESVGNPKLADDKKVPFGVDPKTILCRFYLDGRCERGGKCPFSHDLDAVKKVEKGLRQDTTEVHGAAAGTSIQDSPLQKHIVTLEKEITDLNTRQSDIQRELDEEVYYMRVLSSSFCKLSEVNQSEASINHLTKALEDVKEELKKAELHLGRLYAEAEALENDFATPAESLTREPSSSKAAPIDLPENSNNPYSDVEEAFARYKESLDLCPTIDLSSPSEPRRLIPISLTTESPGRPAIKFSFPLTPSNPLKFDSANTYTMWNNPSRIKEGAKYNMTIRFQVQHGILFGLQYTQVVKRGGLRVSKDHKLLGSYAPNTDKVPFYEKRFAEQEAPVGFLSRGYYTVMSTFVDHEEKKHLEFEWAFDVVKEW